MKKLHLKKIVALAIAVLCLVSCLAGCKQRPAVNPDDPMVVQFQTIQDYFDKPKNIILMIGDGMGQNQVKLGAELTGGHYEGKAYMQYLPNQGFSKTNSLDGVTDSAAGGTALACGYKTHNGMLGQDGGGHDVKNLAEVARENGMRTGVLTTKSATDATPAAFSSHIGGREYQDKIAAQQLEIGNIPNVLIGAGLEYYENALDAKPVLKQGLEDNKISHLKTPEELTNAATDGEYLLCTTQDSPDLVLATEKALELLNKDDDKGFFLMIEGGKIDSYCHSNEMPDVLREFTEFDKCVGVVMEFMIENPDTMLIITADHETGDLQYIENPAEGEEKYKFGSGAHSDADVNIFAAGKGTQYFNGKTMENVEIAKFLAKQMGERKFGQ